MPLFQIFIRIHNFKLLKYLLCTQSGSSLHETLQFHQVNEIRLVAEEKRLQAAKGNVWLWSKQNQGKKKKEAKYFRRGICLIAAPWEVIYVPTSYVGFMCLLVCYSIKKCVLTMATPISPDTQANFESCRAPSQSNTQTSHQISIDANFFKTYHWNRCAPNAVFILEMLFAFHGNDNAEL